jgi:hypothetical protein
VIGSLVVVIVVVVVVIVVVVVVVVVRVVVGRSSIMDRNNTLIISLPLYQAPDFMGLEG